MSAVDLTRLGVDPADAEALDAAVRDGAPGHLVLVSGPDVALVHGAVVSALRARLRGPEAGLDLHVAVPEGDRWTLAEVDDRILAPARLKAFERTRIVVAEADQMSGAAFDHVLKTVEEPSSGAQFWFCVTDPDRLPLTLRGRSAAGLVVRPAPVRDRVGLLEQAGASPEVAREVADLAGHDVRLALAVAAQPELCEHLRTYRRAPLGGSAPTADADRVLAAVIALAAALPAVAEVGSSPVPRKRRAATRSASRETIRPRWDSLSPAARAEGRRLVGRLLDRWSTDTLTRVAAVTTPSELRAVDAALRALDQARLELACNASAATVLPALLARAGQPR